MKEHIHSRIAKLLVVLALAVVASVMFVFVGCSSECAHENTHTETVAATCTTAGHTDTVCDDCGETIKTETIDALGHDWDEGTVVAATCTSGGYTLKTCTVCGAQQQTNLTTAKGHDWSDWSVQTAATCTTTGLEVRTCASCKAEESRVLSATGHDWSDWSVQTAATCSASGLEVRTCTKCDAEESRILPATGNHHWVATDEVVAPTCETNGYTVYKCSECDSTKQDDIVQATGHDWDDTTILRYEPTCTKDGYSYYQCKNCSDKKPITVLKATGHTLVWDDTAELVPATCTADGSITATCSVCTDEVTYTAASYAEAVKNGNAPKIDETILAANGGQANFLKALGHAYYSVKSEAFTTADIPAEGELTDMYFVCEDIGTIGEGEDADNYTGYSLVCTRCEDVRVKTAAHTPDDENAYACVDGGENKNDGFAWECTVCGHQEKVKAHTFEMVEIATGEVAAEGTAFNCLYQIKCTVCGEIEDERGPHMEPDPENPADADCLATCEHDALCTACGEAVFGGKLDHELIELDFGESVNNATAVDSTCTTQGLKVYACRMCMERAETKDVTWTTLEKLPDGTADATDGTIYKTKDGNFFTTGIKLKAHVYNDEDTVVVDVNGNPLEKADCTKEYYYIDYCENCDNPRIEVKGEEDEAALAPSGRPWTDAQGKYQDENDTVYEEHAFELIVDKDTYYDANGNLKPGIAEAGYRLPNCVTDGYMMYKCGHDGCEVDKWAGVTLEAYAEALGKEVDDLLAMPEYHAGDMPACGHNVCDVCETSKIHTAQYTLTFVVSGDETVPEGAELPQIGMFTGWSCYLENEDWARFEAFMSEINKNNTLYSLAYYRTYNAENDTYSNQIADLNAWKAMLVPTSGTDTFREKATIYVVCSLKDGVKDNDNYSDPTNIFYTGYPTTIKWVNDNITDQRSQYLDIELCIDTDVIKPEEVESLSITLKNGSGEGAKTVATAVCNTEAQLAAFVNSCNTIWGKAEGNKQWIQIEEFCSKVSEEAYLNLDGSFMVTNTLEYKTCLDGYVLEIELVAGGVTFERTITITDTQEYLYATPDATLPVLVDVPAASTGDTVTNAD